MGILIGLVLGLIIATLPAVLIAFSKLISGQKKVIWVICVLVIPYILKIVAGILVHAIQGNALPYGLGPVIPLTWYISAWAIYFYFKNKYGEIKDQKYAKIAIIVFIFITVLSALYYATKVYRESDANIIASCGSEKIFTKNSHPNKLYFTSNYISENSSSHIGELEGDNIILKDGYNNIKRIKACLEHSDNINIIYPEGSIYNKTYKWEKNIHIIESTLIFSSNASRCSPGKYDKRENYEYLKWRNKYSDKSIKRGDDSFLFDINGTVQATKAETIEFINNYFRWCPYSANEFKYIFTTSFMDSSRIILWKFSNSGAFIKEIHINLPNNMRLEEGKGHHISHIKITDDTIQFRIYKIFQGNKDQKWRSMCSYNVFEIDNI